MVWSGVLETEGGGGVSLALLRNDAFLLDDIEEVEVGGGATTTAAFILWPPPVWVCCCCGVFVYNIWFDILLLVLLLLLLLMEAVFSWNAAALVGGACDGPVDGDVVAKERFLEARDLVLSFDCDRLY